MNNNINLVVFEPENVKTIAELGPVAINENNLSHDKCLEAGKLLLSRVQAAGMNDSLDQDIAQYIEKAKRTVKKMNSRRMPITKIFDAIRASFTSLESDINPTSKGSIPEQLQEYRNKFAAAKREEAIRRQREEAARLERERAIERYKNDVREDLKRQYNDYSIACVNRLAEMDNKLTLDNYEFVEDGIRNFPGSISDEWFSGLQPAVNMPNGIELAENKKIVEEIKTSLRQIFTEQYAFDVVDYANNLLDRLPSKRKELERIAQSNAAEAAHLREELERKEREEAMRKEREIREAEAKEREKAEFAAKANEMDSLFGISQVTANIQSYQPKAQVKKVLHVLDTEGFVDIIGLWWSQVGCTMTVEDLNKMFSKQITFCNKIANDKINPILIESEHLEYVDDIKAR